MSEKGKKKNAGNSEFLHKIREKAKNGTLKGIWRDWLWIWSFSRRRWVSVVLYTLLGIGSSLLALVSGVVSKYMIDSIVAVDLSRLLPCGLLMVLTAGLSVAFQSLSSRFSARLGVRMYNDVQAKVFDSIIEADWMSVSRYASGDLLSRFSGDVSTVAGCAVSWLPNVVIQLFTLLATLGVILYYDPIMALIGCASTPLMLLLSRRLLRRQRDYNQRMREVGSGISAFQSETFRNLDTIKGFGAGDLAKGKFRRWQKDYESIVMEHNEFSIRTNVWMTLMGTAVQYLALGYCLWRLWRGDILFGTMTLFLQQRSSLTGAFSSLVALVPTALSGSVAAERIRELTQLPREPRQETLPPMPDGSCAVAVEGVAVGYRQDLPVLSGVNIRADAGEVVALVGPSGEGKTTLLRLLLGLIRPEAGTLALEDAQGCRWQLGADTRHFIAYVPQGNTLIAGTVAENLTLGCRDGSQAEMIACLKDACAWEFVEDMPGGLQALIGEGGKGLSEGQAQRIAIARGLMRKAPVMLLDEVTSALDQDTERRVLANLIRRGVTTVVTTHRPSVLTLCTRVYRVENGTVTQLTDAQKRQYTGPKG